MSAAENSRLHPGFASRSASNILNIFGVIFLIFSASSIAFTRQIDHLVTKNPDNDFRRPTKDNLAASSGQEEKTADFSRMLLKSESDTSFASISRRTLSTALSGGMAGILPQEEGGYS
ncbi:uncharacterized protein F5147DRAFT_767134 [Suillus discolor]|uniref:Uncharacterized protein n=1 Tax=Suillus discolor TaxID=1912936 RepID=A0A9P7K0G6_9AGAM|nr:uncharacterized protein F5147DRAFT_767134 [Suillus discolor]KAG2119661.1 hypothetical protein F5147DRAFT_767134 [Suillus discolor]